MKVGVFYFDKKNEEISLLRQLSAKGFIVTGNHREWFCKCGKYAP